MHEDRGGRRWEHVHAELVDGIARLRDEIEVDQLVLCDPDSNRLDTVAGVSRRIAGRHGWPGTLTATSDLAEAVDGAEFVLLQLRIGGQAARHLDETIPLRCGCVGQETTGAGGFAKALRTVPVVLDIADEVRRRAASDAWIIDFTNPVGHRHPLVARQRSSGDGSVQRRDRVPAPVRRAGSVSTPRRCGWVTPASTISRGSDRSTLAARTSCRSSSRNTASNSPTVSACRCGCCIRSARCRRTTSATSTNTISWSTSSATQRTRAEEVIDIERELLEIYRDPSVDTKPELLARRGGAFYSEAAVQLLAALWNDTGDIQVVDVRNNGALPELPDDAIVEIPCVDQPFGRHAGRLVRAAPGDRAGSSARLPPTSGLPQRRRSPATAKPPFWRCSPIR